MRRLARPSPSTIGGMVASRWRFTRRQVTRVGAVHLRGGMMMRSPWCLQPRMAPPRASTMKLTRKLKGRADSGRVCKIAGRGTSSVEATVARNAVPSNHPLILDMHGGKSLSLKVTFLDSNALICIALLFSFSCYFYPKPKISANFCRQWS